MNEPASATPEFCRPTTTEAGLDLLNAIESRYPVDTWKAGDLHVWPLVRYDLCAHNYFIARGTEHSRVHGRFDAMRERLRTIALQSTGWLKARRADRAHEDRIRPADVVLYTDGASFSWLDGAWVDRHCDPLADLARERGLDPLLLSPGAQGLNYVPRRTPSVLIQPRIDLHAQLGAARARFAPHELPLELDGFDELMARLEKELPGLPLMTRDRLRRTAAYIEAFAGMYRRMLRRIRPRAVFVVCYYGTERMAMLRAARQLGIPSVDIQHGAAATHWAYARWARLPAQGYDLLPTYFWVWNAATRDAIDAWAVRYGRFHRAVLAGNPFLDRWKDGTADFVRSHDEHMRALVEPHAAKEHVLLTANGYEPVETIRRIAALVRATGDRVHWWIRMHPARLHAASTFESELRAVGAANWYIRESTEAPLYGLLRFMDFHVTEISSSVIEAAQMGVPSVFTASHEAVIYMSLVREGWALPVDGFDGVEAGLARQRERRSELRSRLAAERHPDARDALATIVPE